MTAQADLADSPGNPAWTTGRTFVASCQRKAQVGDKIRYSKWKEDQKKVKPNLTIIIQREVRLDLFSQPNVRTGISQSERGPGSISSCVERYLDCTYKWLKNRRYTFLWLRKYYHQVRQKQCGIIQQGNTAKTGTALYGTEGWSPKLTCS